MPQIRESSWLKRDGPLSGDLKVLYGFNFNL
jgi:hypothetical protein